MAKSKTDTIDDLLSDMRNRKHGKLEDSFKNYEQVTGEDQLNRLALSLLQPGVDEFYTTFTNELDKIKGFSDDKSIDNKSKKDVQAAAVAAFKAFFKKTRPSVLEAVKDVKDVEEQYRLLADQYNQHMAIGGNTGESGIDQIIETYIGNKSAKGATLKRHLYNVKSDHVDRAVQSYKTQAYSHFIGTYHAPEVAAHLGRIAAKKGYEITDDARFMHMGHNALLNLHYGLTTGEFGKAGHKGYNLREKKDKK